VPFGTITSAVAWAFAPKAAALSDSDRVFPVPTLMFDVPGETGDGVGSGGRATIPVIPPCVDPESTSRFVCTSPKLAFVPRRTESALTLRVVSICARADVDDDADRIRTARDPRRLDAVRCVPFVAYVA
jgi:hypothetical protein